MIDFEQAKQIALDHIGPDCGLIEEETLEKPYGWYFRFQTKAWLQTRSIMDMRFGSSGFVVDRETGRLYKFASGIPHETQIASYEKGFRYERYDLTIIAVQDMKLTVERLYELTMQFIVPEVASGREWLIPQSYEPDQVHARLKKLPCIFRNQAFWHRVDVFEEITAAGCCTFELREHLPDDFTERLQTPGEPLDGSTSSSTGAV